jgi:hypothetical protein
MTAADLIVTLLSPHCAPWVLDDPVRLVSKTSRSKPTLTITDQQNTVVKVPLVAEDWARHSTYVSLHEFGIDSNCMAKIRASVELHFCQDLITINLKD